MKILLDPYGLHTPAPGDLVVSDDDSYVAARRQMLAFRRGLPGTPKAIVVPDPIRAQWFGDVPEWTETVRPRQQLQTRYPGVQLPPDLSDADVRELDLLGPLLTEAGIEPTERALLRHYFNNRLSRNLADPLTVYGLAQVVLQEPEGFWKAYLVRKWNEKLSSTDAVAGKLLQPIRARNHEFCRILAEGIYVAGMPELLENWLHDNGHFVKTTCGVSEAELRRFLSQPTRLPATNPALETRVEAHVIEMLRTNPATLRTLPGRHVGEINAILSVAPTLSEVELEPLLTTYADLLNADLRRGLRALVPPTLLPIPPLDGLPLKEQAGAWQRWAVGSFIPFKFWLDEQKNRSDEILARVEAASIQYAEWLYRHYRELMDRDDILTNLGVRNQIAELSRAGNCRVIWLIIDGFPAAYAGLLTDTLAQHGLNRVTTRWAFAALPTITSIGIPALLNGQRANSDGYEFDNYRLALKQAFPGQTTVFEASVGRFQKALHADTDIVCLHWIEVDDLMHKPDYQLKRARAEAVKGLLDEQIRQVAEVIQQSVGRKTRLVIATDHGATKCLRNGSGISNAKLAEAIADHAKERCIRLGGKVKREHLDDAETRLLSREMTHLPEEWVVAWGYRYFGANDHGYRHGGLSPEETIVPVVVAEVTDYEFKKPQLRYVGGQTLRLGNREKDFILQLRNPNDYPVEIRALVIDEDSKYQAGLPVTVPGNGTLNLTAPIRLSQGEKPQQGRLLLHVRAEYRAQGDGYTDSLTVEVPIQTSEVDDFFDSL
ncbi:MAG: PglZ domain-containing protein [Cytophagaceae bacterium]|nr:PglZ domain-containing protein [Cytophagaceae bacterium]